MDQPEALSFIRQEHLVYTRSMALSMSHAVPRDLWKRVVENN